MIIKLFRAAGATGHVFLVKNGKTRDMGLAYSGLIGPQTTVAVVPTIPQTIDFAIEAQTKDKQEVIVSGSVTATLLPPKAVSRFDFTVDVRSGGYLGNWRQALQARVVERVLRAVLEKVRGLNVEEATRSQKEVEDAVTVALGANALEGDGVAINSCSVPKIEAADEEVANSIGSQERQAMLTEADRALHDRRLKGAANERTVKQYEADTKLELEKKQGALIAEKAKNTEMEATADAKATEIKLGPLKDLEPGNLLGAALMEGFKTGRIGSISVAPELLGALAAHKAT
jgi:hypothetical protein